jgi:hypothetical protein
VAVVISYNLSQDQMVAVKWKSRVIADRDVILIASFKTAIILRVIFVLYMIIIRLM